MLKVFSLCLLLFSPVFQVSWKGHNFLAFGLELAQPFLNTVFLLSRTGKASNSHWEKLVSRQIWTMIITKYYFSPCTTYERLLFFHPRIKSLNLTIFRKIIRKKPPNLQIDGGEVMLLVKVGNDGFKSRVRTLMPGPIQFRDQLNFVWNLQLFKTVQSMPHQLEIIL